MKPSLIKFESPETSPCLASRYLGSTLGSKDMPITLSDDESESLGRRRLQAADRHITDERDDEDLTRTPERATSITHSSNKEGLRSQNDTVTPPRVVPDFNGDHDVPSSTNLHLNGSEKSALRTTSSSVRPVEVTVLHTPSYSPISDIPCRAGWELLDASSIASPVSNIRQCSPPSRLSCDVESPLNKSIVQHDNVMRKNKSSENSFSQAASVTMPRLEDLREQTLGLLSQDNEVLPSPETTKILDKLLRPASLATNSSLENQPLGLSGGRARLAANQEGKQVNIKQNNEREMGIAEPIENPRMKISGAIHMNAIQPSAAEQNHLLTSRSNYLQLENQPTTNPRGPTVQHSTSFSLPKVIRSPTGKSPPATNSSTKTAIVASMQTNEMHSPLKQLTPELFEMDWNELEVSPSTPEDESSSSLNAPFLVPTPVLAESDFNLANQELSPRYRTPNNIISSPAPDSVIKQKGQVSSRVTSGYTNHESATPVPSKLNTPYAFTAPVSTDSSISDAQTKLERRLSKPITYRDPNSATLELLIAYENGHIEFENIFPFQHAQDSKLTEFFDFYSSVAGVPIARVTKLRFTVSFDKRQSFEVSRRHEDAANNERLWKMTKNTIFTIFTNAQKECTDETEVFHVLVEMER